MKRLFIVAIGFLCLIGNPGTGRADTLPMLGSILIFGSNFCPLYYTPMDGRIMPITGNTALFSLLGILYGGNGTSNFALPNAKPIYTATRATFTQCIATTGFFPSQN